MSDHTIQMVERKTITIQDIEQADNAYDTVYTFIDNDDAEAVLTVRKVADDGPWELSLKVGDEEEIVSKGSIRDLIIAAWKHVPKCEDCGSTEDLTYGPCPFDMELNSPPWDDIWLCDDCYSARAMEI